MSVESLSDPPRSSWIHFAYLKQNGRKRLDQARHEDSRDDEEEGSPPQGVPGHEDGDHGGQEDVEDVEAVIW